VGSDPYRSGLERRIARSLGETDQAFRYESLVIPYTPPPQKKRYTPDFVFPNGVVVEAKGRLTTANRRKLKHVKARYPDLDIRLVFGRATNTISKKSDTTYAMWCDRYGFPWADDGIIPSAWLDEPKDKTRIRAIREIQYRWNHRVYDPDADIPDDL